MGVISVILLGVWVYLLFFYTPSTSREDGLFANFGWFADQDVTPVAVPPPVVEEIPLVNVAGPRLRQLTTRPVAGYRELLSTSTAPAVIRYVEAGLGHIYDINLETGEEIRVSNTTVPQALTAALSPDGSQVAIRADVTARNTVTVGAIENGALTSSVLGGAITDFTFADTGELYYTTVPAQGTDTIAQARNLRTGTTRELFTVPFRAAAINWAVNGRTTHYTYTKPAAQLIGYAYRIADGGIVREPISGDGLVIVANDRYLAYSVRTGNTHQPLVYNRDTQTSSPLFVLPLPEKCTFASDSLDILYCGYEFAPRDHTYPDAWYKGIINSNDSLWYLDLTDGLTSQLVVPRQAIGRELDMTLLQHSAETDMLYFINKHDKTLWVYELVAR